MKILHTSDWHLGRSLYGRKRYEEFSAFLDWLADTIVKESIDVLLIAGDVFDTNTPGNRAQELYYRFLSRISLSCCRHIVVIAGNHDSPSFLNAPGELLKAMNVHVIGAITGDPANEVIVLKIPAAETLAPSVPDQTAIICAVPYLRDRDIRNVEAGETFDDKNKKLISGIQNHYERVANIATQKQEELRKSSPEGVLPIIAMGHLFTAGGKTMDGDGVRDLYVGSLACVDAKTFPRSIDYVALGHLHVPQKVGQSSRIRYCGSPIPMGFGEANQEKSVVVLEFESDPKPAKGSIPNTLQPSITILPVPRFQDLERITGSLEEIRTRLEHLKSHHSNAWLEIEYTGEDLIGNLSEMLDETIAGSFMEILRIRNRNIMDRVIHSMHNEETLDDLNVNDVFDRCLHAFDVPDEEKPELKDSYREIVRNLIEEDVHAE